MEFSLKYSTIYDYSYFFIVENIIKVSPATHLLLKMLVIYVVLFGKMLCCIFAHLSGNSKFGRAIESKLKKCLCCHVIMNREVPDHRKTLSAWCNAEQIDTR